MAAPVIADMHKPDHIWILGVVYEPQYSYSRVMLTKLIIFGSLFDDLYDNYSTTEESSIFTAAMERWGEQAAEKLPGNLKALYINILNTTNGIEEELKRQKNKNAEMVKELREQISQHVVSTVQTCTKEHGITVAEANEKLKVIIEEAWMDIVHECLHKEQPMTLLEKAMDLARTMDFMYKCEDAFTLPSNLKETLTSLYVNYV